MKTGVTLLRLILSSALVGGSLDGLAAENLLLPEATESSRLREWRELKYGMFLHFGMSTFTGKELDPGDQPSATYAPKHADAEQWIRVAKAAGMKYAVLTAKHVAGHCLWDSKVQFRGKEFDYDVATSGNTNDVVRAFVDACATQGIAPGLYYCLLDFRNNPIKPEHQWGRHLLPDEYFALAKGQLTELARNYPAVRYYWLDIPRAASEAQRAELYDLLRRENPGCVVMFNCGFLDKKNQGGFTIESTKGASWPTDVLNSERDVIPGGFNPVHTWRGTNWFLGYEHCDVVGKDWFWTASDQARPTDKLFELYHDTVIRAGGNLLLDVGPNREGKLDDWQVAALVSLKQRIDARTNASLILQGFQAPPAAAHPTVWWRFMDDFMAREGIVNELDFMRRAGLSGGVVSYCASNSKLVNSQPGLPQIPILSPAWWDMVGFQLREAKQRDLDLWIQMCPGYATSGGPWITPEMSMQKLVWSETGCDGATNFDGVLPQPKVDKRWKFYRDVAVLAVPQLAGNAAVRAEQVINLTEFMHAAGRLQWKPSAGQWKIFRLGHTTTGKPIHPVTKTGGGLECDKLNREAARIQFNSYFKKMLEQCPADQRGSVQLFFDSWEADSQNWTPRFREEFQRRRGYDPLPWLLVATGQVIGSEELSRRFDYDWKTTIEELINTEHFAELARLAHENGCMEFRAQPYNGPVNFMTAGALFDIPEGEFWFNKRDYGWWSLRQIASVSHVNGKKIAAAESLTSLADQHHLDADPFAMKAETDLAFTMGINNMAIHAMAHNPWPKLKPGMTTGFFPPLLGDWQVWNDFASPWISYLSRCCYLLQQGTFQADVVTLFRVGQKGFTPPAGYAGDLCNEELIISSMTWDGSALCLPGGMRYKVLELVDTTKFTVNYVSPSGINERTAGKPLPQSISLPLLRKVRELVLAGATVVGPKPVQAAGLTVYPQSDEEVARIANELWGAAADGMPVDRKVGKGRVFSDVPVAEVLVRIGVTPDFKTVEAVSADEVPWIHRRVGEDDFYFVSNQKNERVKVTGSFRLDGKIPEVWHADTGAVEPARSWRQKDGRTEVDFDFDPRGSVFVRFAPGRTPAVQAQASAPTVLGTMDLSADWTVRFDPSMGAPAEVEFPKLVSWTAHAEKGIRYYSGVAKYERAVTLPGKLLSPGSKIALDLGEVKNLARITVNGTAFPELWKPPFRCDITPAVKPGVNQVAVEVVNVWANRMIGDEQEPPDVEWNTVKVRDGNNPLAAIPDWVINGTPRPSPERRTFTTWNYIKNGQKLLPAGLLGPVTISSTTDAVTNR